MYVITLWRVDLFRKGKNTRIATLNLTQTKIPKVSTSLSLQMLQYTDIDYTCFPKCKTCKMVIVASFLNYQGTLVNIKELNYSKTKNQASSPKSTCP